MPNLLSLPDILSWGNRSGSKSGRRQNSPAPRRSSSGHTEGRKFSKESTSSGHKESRAFSKDSVSGNFGRLTSSPPSVIPVVRPHDSPTPSFPLDAPDHHGMSGAVVAAKRSGLQHGATMEMTDGLQLQLEKDKHQTRIDKALAATDRLGSMNRPHVRTRSRLAAGLAATDQLEVRTYDTFKVPPPDWADFRRQWSKSSNRHADLEGSAGHMSDRRDIDFKRMVTC